MAQTQHNTSSRTPTLIPKLATLKDGLIKFSNAPKQLKQAKLLGGSL